MVRLCVLRRKKIANFPNHPFIKLLDSYRKLCKKCKATADDSYFVDFHCINMWFLDSIVGGCLHRQCMVLNVVHLIHRSEVEFFVLISHSFDRNWDYIRWLYWFWRIFWKICKFPFEELILPNVYGKNVNLHFNLLEQKQCLTFLFLTF